MLIGPKRNGGIALRICNSSRNIHKDPETIRIGVKMECLLQADVCATAASNVAE